jgi:hypothetical protein
MPSETTTTPRHILTVTESNWDLEVTQENWELTLTYTDGNPITITNELVNAAIEDDPAATGVSLGLGTAAYAETTDFATAAQGTDERVPTAAGLTSKFSTAKATPVDNDRVAIFDSAASNAPKHTLWSSVKSTLKSYFDTVYAAIVHTHVSADITDASPITASNGGKVLKSTAEGTLESISIVNASSSYLQVGVSGKDGVAAFSSYGNRLDGTAIAEIYMQRSSTAEASIRVDNLTGVREIQFPDASGTLALTSDITDAVTSNTTSDGTCDLWINTLTVGSVGTGGVLDVQDNGTFNISDGGTSNLDVTANGLSILNNADEQAVVSAQNISVLTPTSSASLSGNGNIDGTGDLTIGGTGSFGSDVTVDGTTTTDTVQFDTTVTSATAGVGELNWNDSDGTLNLGLKGGNVTLQIGQESVARVVNKTGANLLESQYRAVRIRSAVDGGAVGQRLAVVLAQANNDANSVDTLGLVTENIDNNQEGFVTTSGIVRGINTTGSLQGETWVDGDVLYLSPTTAGQLTKVKPQAPEHTVIMGYVLYAHNNQGKIYVKVDNGYELNELHNVRINGAVDGEFLMYNGTDEVWGNYAIDKATVGLDQVDNTADVDKPISYATRVAITAAVQDVPPADIIVVFLADLNKTVSLYLSPSETVTGFSDYEANDDDGNFWKLFRTGNYWVMSVDDGVNTLYYAEMSAPTSTYYAWDVVLLGAGSWNVTLGYTSPDISAPRTGSMVIEPQGVWQFAGKWRLIIDSANIASGVYDFLISPTSATFYSILADKTGTNLIVFNQNPTLSNPTVTNYTESVVSIGNSGTSKTISLTSGTFQTVTLTGNCTFTMPTATAGKSFILKVMSGTGGFAATFTGVRWSGGTAPTITTTASRYDLVSFVADGSAWSGSILQNFTV